MKRELLLILGLALGIFLIANVSSSIYFSQLDSVYNIGDMIEMSVNVSPEDSGPLQIVLMCDNNSLDVYKGAPTELLQLPLTSLWMNGMTGDCHFTGYYGGEIKESTGFKISKKLNLNLYTSSFYAKPGESITISGNVQRLNGENINGDVEILIPLIAGSNGSKEILYGIVSNGEFSINYNVKKDNPAGEYRIDIIAYEKTANERTSEGYEMASLQVSQAVKDIDIALDTQNIEPGKSISFKPILNDQSGKQMAGELAVIIKDSLSNRVFQSFVKSGDTVKYDVPTNLTAGYYEIQASTDSLSKIKSFHVSEKALVSFEIVNGTLIIKNIGNVPYNKPINVKINDQSFLITSDEIGNIPPGAKKEFKLTSDKASGNSIKVNDDTTELTKDDVSLPVAKKPNVITGGAISISGLTNTPIVWIIVLIILALVILFLFKDIFKKKSVAYPAPIKSRTNVEGDTSIKIIKLDRKGQEIKNEPIERISSAAYTRKQMEDRGIGEKELSPVMKPRDSPAYAPYKSSRVGQPIRQETKPGVISEKKEGPVVPMVKTIEKRRPDAPSEAEQVLVTDGERNRAAIIAVKIKNTINKFSKENLERSIEHVYEKKGAVYEHGNFIFIIFSPLITKSFRNEIEAVKGAEKIAEGLKEHNRKFSDKIDFGIGINSGDIINKIENKKLKFTSLGTLTIAARKLAELSNGEILMTKEAYDKAMSEVKAEKKSISGTEVYEVKKVADYDKNRKFINDFIRREGDNRNKSMIPRHSVNPSSKPYWIKDEGKKEDINQPKDDSINKIFD